MQLAKIKNLTAIAIFVDVVAAYDSVVRRLLVDCPDPEQDERAAAKLCQSLNISASEFQDIIAAIAGPR